PCRCRTRRPAGLTPSPVSAGPRRPDRVPPSTKRPLADPRARSQAPAPRDEGPGLLPPAEAEEGDELRPPAEAGDRPGVAPEVEDAAAPPRLEERLPREVAPIGEVAQGQRVAPLHREEPEEVLLLDEGLARGAVQQGLVREPESEALDGPGV